MLRISVLVVLFVGSSAMAKPTFQDVHKKFPAATLPITIKAADELKIELNAADANALGFLKDTSPGLSALRDCKKKGDKELEKEFTRALWAVATVQRTGHELLLLRCDFTGPMMSTRETFLLAYNDKGELLGGITFNLLISGEGGEASEVSTLDQAGVVSRLTKWKYPMMEEGLPEELKVTSEQRAKLTSRGAIEVMPAAWSTRSGSYIDRKSKEELRVFDKRVFYRANDTKPFQELEGDGNTMRFKGSPKPYLLTWNDRRSAISCENPDGAVQLFDREW